MNNLKLKKGLEYILAFISSVVLLITLVLTVLNLTVLNRSFVKQSFEKYDYYIKTQEDLLQDMKSYIMPSGLADSVLDGLCTASRIKNDINAYIDAMYTGVEYHVDIESFTLQLEENIEKYLNEKNITSRGTELDEFVQDMGEMYVNAIEFYGYPNIIKKYFAKIIMFSYISISISLIIFIALMLVLKKITHVKYTGVVPISSGLMGLFLIVDIYSKIDVKNIWIITESFSEVIIHIINGFKYKMFVISILSILIGVYFTVKNAYKKKKRHKND